jgi:hypothetical protein
MVLFEWCMGLFGWCMVVRVVHGGVLEVQIRAVEPDSENETKSRIR